MTVTSTSPIPGQDPGTSGLRKPVDEFLRPHYVENYIQSVFDAVGSEGRTFVVGGDGRYPAPAVIQTIIRMAAANGVRKLVIGRDGLLSTPAAANLIRLHRADGGLLLTASHNPGGPDGDFGIKIQGPHGGPASRQTCGGIYDASRRITQYRISDIDPVDLSPRIRTVIRAGMLVDVIDPVVDHLDQMERIFDLDPIHGILTGGFCMRYDAMHAVTGPYATALFEERLGAPEGSVINAVPRPDFSGVTPDPNPHNAASLVSFMRSDAAVDFGAASDGDGDRAMIVGRDICLSPCDSLAVMAANAHLIPAHADGLAGVGRSYPTSRAVDRVAKRLGIERHVIPVGWRHLSDLMRSGKASICGEESYGAGSCDTVEKDGLWTILYWLSIIAARRMSVSEIMRDHWRLYGRDYHSRHDFGNVDPDRAESLMTTLRASRLDRTHISDGRSRATVRLSNTGTRGATLRVYMERYEPPGGNHAMTTDDALRKIRNAIYGVISPQKSLGRSGPDITT